MSSASETSILTFHSLDDSGSAISIAPAAFRRAMESLAASGLPVLPLASIREAARGVALTFDDGFVNFHRQAMPVLGELGFPATVFVVSGHCGGHNDWAQPPGVPRLALMGWSELAEIASAGIDVGAHTVRHRRLPALAASEAEREMADCRRQIEDRLARPVTAFAYPFGAVSSAVREIAGRHYRLACGVELDYLRPSSDPLCLPRLDMYYLRGERQFARFLRGRASRRIAARRWLRGARSRLRV
jgi:peptidoglycan/xylan/chitin deacetylase (PgdA/CDA1 family)